MQKYSKLSLALFFIISLVFICFVAIIIYINDPLEIWHKAFFRDNAYGHARLAARAFIRDYNFDSVIIGNSHSENISAKRAGEILGGKFFNLSVSGSTMAEKSVILKYLFKHKKIKKVVYFIDTHYQSLNREAPNYSLDTYSFLYDNNILNDYKIYLNDKYFRCAFSFNEIPFCVKPYDIDCPFRWNNIEEHTKRFGGFDNWIKNKENEQIKGVFKTIISTPSKINKNHVDVKYKTGLYDYLDKDFFEIIKNNPNVDFYVVIPPVSSLELAIYIRGQSFEKYKLMLNYIVYKNAEYPNMKIYAFDNLDIIGKIEDFKDTSHFKPWIDYFILESIAQNNQRITPLNIDKYIKEVYNKALKTDFESYRSKIKSAMGKNIL